MSSQRILIVTDYFPPEAGAGAEAVAFSHARGLGKMGYDIRVFAATKNNSMSGWGEYDGLRLYRVYSNYHERWRQYVSLYNPPAVWFFKRILRDWGPDVIHFHNVHEQLSYYLFALARRQTRRVFLTAHDSQLFAYGKIDYFLNRPKLAHDESNYKLPHFYNLLKAKKRYNPFKNFFIRVCLVNIKKIFCVSRALEQALRQNLILNTTVIHNGIDVGTWQKDQSIVEQIRSRYQLHNSQVVMFAGRLGKEKGWNSLLRAWPLVIQKYRGAKLLVVGHRGSMDSQLPEELKNSIIFTGRIPRQDMRHYFHACDIVVVPSVYLDPFPTINLEAMACSKPVIGTCYGGTPEAVVNNQTGFIVNPENIERFAEKILYLLNNPRMATVMGQAGYDRVKKEFNEDHWLQQLINNYRD